MNRDEIIKQLEGLQNHYDDKTANELLDQLSNATPATPTPKLNETKGDEIMTTLKEMIDKRKAEAFIDPSSASDAEALGLVISKYFEWDGVQIFEAFLSALEDSNFHTEHEKVSEIYDGMMTGAKND